MELKECFDHLVNTIHSVVISTVSEKGLPEARVIGLLGYDEGGIYFSTGVGKNFHTSLLARPEVVVTGLSGATTLEQIMVSVRGVAREMDDWSLTDKLLHDNPDMLQIYPTEESRRTVRVFYVDKGELDWYDLSKQPLERFQFAFGDIEVDLVAKKRALLNRLAPMLVIELGLEGRVEVPAGEAEKAALVDELLADHPDVPLSADLLEVLNVYQAL